MRVAILATLLLFSIASIVAAEEAGVIEGLMLAGDNPQALAIGAGVVVLCDATTGIPFSAKTHEPITRSNFDGTEDLRHAVIQGGMGYQFENVPPGRYRLIAQSWSGIAGMAPMEPDSSLVLPLGVAVTEVKPGETATVHITPLGRRRLDVKLDPDADGTFIFVSTSPLRFDPIMGFISWGDAFTSNIVAAAHRARPYVTFIGLPDEGELYVTAFSYDNLAGFGGAVVKPGESEVTVPLLAVWSDGKDEPPARLLPLVEHMERTKESWIDLAKLTPPARPGEETRRLDHSVVYDMLMLNPERLVAVKEVGEFAVIDIAAAGGYRDLRESHRESKAKREERRRRLERSQPGAPAAEIKQP